MPGSGELMSTPVVDDPFGVLRRVLRPRPRVVPGEQCDMCAEPIGESHSHVANVGDRRLLCTCRGCYLLFTVQGAGGLKMRAVPEEYRRLDELSFTQEQWDDLAIPVDLVFLFRQSDPTGDGRAQYVALYPSPAGATESELDPATWQRIADANPAIAALEDDVAAALIRRTGPGEFTCLLVPVDACYELVGIVRKHWSGFSGGAEVWERIDAFFAELSSRVRRVIDLEFACTGAHPDLAAAGPTIALQLHISETHRRRRSTRWRCAASCGSSRSAGATTTPRRRRCATCSASGPAGATRSSRCSSASSARWCRASPARPTSTWACRCSYDVEVAAHKYLHGLDDGDVPLLLLFSGTVFTTGANGVSVQPVPWHKEAQFRLPITVWQQTMELHFPGTAWARLDRETFDALQAYRTREQLLQHGRGGPAAVEGGGRWLTSTRRHRSPTPCCSRVTCSIPTGPTTRRTGCAGSSACSCRPPSPNSTRPNARGCGPTAWSRAATPR